MKKLSPIDARVMRAKQSIRDALRVLDELQPVDPVWEAQKSLLQAFSTLVEYRP